MPALHPQLLHPRPLPRPPGRVRGGLLLHHFHDSQVTPASRSERDNRVPRPDQHHHRHVPPLSHRVRVEESNRRYEWERFLVGGVWRDAGECGATDDDAAFCVSVLDAEVLVVEEARRKGEGNYRADI